DLRSMTRLQLILILACAVAAFTVAARFRGNGGSARSAVADPPPLAWGATAHQLGPVSYRDPAGAISPDARWIAYSEGRFLRVRPVDGGPSVEFPPGEAQIRNITWSPDGRSIVTDGYVTQGGWAVYDRVDATRKPFWANRHDTNSLR